MSLLCERAIRREFHGETTLYLQQLGWNSHFEQHAREIGMQACIPARIAEEHKDAFTVFSETGVFLAEIAGRIRFYAAKRSDLPAVGDWVMIRARQTEERATIEAILPRQNLILRKGTGKDWSEQILAANVDTIFIMTSLNQDLNLRRLERYLALAWESRSQPVVLLNKADLCADPADFQARVESIAPHIPIHTISARNGTGTNVLHQYLTQGKTAIFIGSSGVGKSTLLNLLAGETLQRVEQIRDWDDRGRHTTTSRQLHLLPTGGIVIDTPGMRLVGMWDHESGIGKVFDDIETLSKQCRFRNCRHRMEPGCAVEAAVMEGTLERDRVENYRKLEAELKFIERKTNVRARAEEKAYAKRISRTIKRIYKDRGR